MTPRKPTNRYGGGNIEKRGEDSWRVTLYVGTDPAGKKQFRRITVRGTKADAERARAKLILDVMDGRPASADTLAGLLDKWYAHKLRDFSPSTARTTLQIIEKTIKPALGTQKIRTLRPAKIDAFYTQLSDAEMSPGYVRRIHGVLHAALEQAIKWEKIDRNPAAATTPPKVPRSAIVPPTPEGVKAIIAVLDLDPELALFVRIASTTGTRRGQVCGLRWPDVNWVAGTLTVSRAIVIALHGIAEKTEGKTSASTRQIALGAQTLRTLESHRQGMIDRALECDTTLPDDAYIFSDDIRGQRPWRPDSTSRRFRMAKEAAIKQAKEEGNGKLAGSLQQTRLHDLKHFAATQMLADGEPIVVVAARLGTDANTILRVYGHFIPGSDQQAAEKMDRLLD